MRRTSASRAGLVFPVARIARNMRKLRPKVRLTKTSSVYMAAVLEYLVAETTELAGNVAKDCKKRRITPRHVFLALASDEELHNLSKTAVIPQGGVIPRILPELLPREKQTSGSVDKPKSAKVSKQQNPIPTSSVVAKKTPAPKKKTSSKKKGANKNRSGADPNKNITGISVLSEKKMHQGKKFLAVSGDILQVVTDVIVHPTDADFSTHGQIGQSLLSVGGTEFTDMITKLKSDLGTLKPLTAIMSTSYNTVAKHVIHCNGPTRKDMDMDAKLQEVVEQCLQLAHHEGLTSIAFPLIGTGGGGLPKPEAAKVFVKSITDYFVNVNTSIVQVYLVLHDTESQQAVVTELSNI